MTFLNAAATVLSVIAMSASGLGDNPEGYPEPYDLSLPMYPWYTVSSNDTIFQTVGDGMIDAAQAALPVGIGVMSVTAGIPVAKKVIKQLGR